MTEDPGASVEETLIARGPVPVLQLEQDGSIVAANDALEDLVGWGEVELLGEPATFVSDRSLDDWEALVAEARLGEEPEPRDLELRTATGVSLRVRVHAIPHAASSASTSIVVVMEDVTDEWERECELELLRRVLRHNIRNRVNVVQGYAEQFAEAVDAEAVDESGAGRTRTPEDPALAASKIDDLLDATESIARASDKATDLRRVFDAERELVEVDVTRTVESVARVVRADHPEAVIAIDAPESATVNALPVLDLAVQNLVTNAVEHNDSATPTVDIAVTTMFEMGQGTVTIAIEDDGPEIPEMELQTLKRGEEDSLNHSSGLGLWIAQWVVARSNGELVYEENAGGGNTIQIRLPQSPGSVHPPM